MTLTSTLLLCWYLSVSLAKQRQEETADSVEGGDDEEGGGGGHMDSDSSDSEMVGPPPPLGYKVMLLLIDVFGTDVLSVTASAITKRSFSRLGGPHRQLQCMIVASLNNYSHSQTFLSVYRERKVICYQLEFGK